MKSIRSKLWLGMMVLIGTIILLLWLFQIIFLERFYSVFEVDNILRNADKTVKKLEELNNLEELDSSLPLKTELEKLINEKQLTIEIVDQEKNIIYQASAGNNTGLPGAMKAAASQTIVNALSGKVVKQKITHPKFGYQFMMIGLPITIDSETGAMLITMPMASVEDTADILKKQLIMITGLLLLISLFISFYLSKKFTDPILKISRQAEAFTDGHFNVKIKRIDKDEIGRLAGRMNRMGDVLAQNELLQKEIVANVSHELRTPLALIRGYAETLRDVTGNNPEKRDKQLGIIIEESQRLSEIVEDILNLSRLQSGALVLEKESFSIKEMLLRLEDHYQLQKEARSFHINESIPVQDNVVGDKGKVEQVLRNLLDNAFHHTKEHEAVEITIVPKNDCIRLEITNSGEAIAPEDMEHIFERYYRGSRTDGVKTNGTGLGLAIVKSIMELHQMPYGVESVKGKGTTFWIELERENSHTSF